MQKIIFNNYVIYDDSTIVSLKLNKAISTHENKGYKRVALYIGAKEKKIFLLHKLMAMSFIDDYKESDRISFIDYNRLNCSLNNLKVMKPCVESLKVGKRNKIYSRYLIDSNGYVFDTKSDRVITAVKGKNGSPRVTLYDKGKAKCQSLPLLIAKNFISDYEEMNDSIIFKNGDNTDCSLNNLIIKKNGCIKEKPTEEMNVFFENQKPYQIIDYYIGYLFNMNKMNFCCWSFTKDDFRQYLADYLWKKMPHYFKVGKYKTYNFKAYAFSIFNNLIKNKFFWKHVTSFYSVMETEDNTFDTYNIGSIISLYEYISDDSVKDNYGSGIKKMVKYNDFNFFRTGV